MDILNESDFLTLNALSELTYCNPFSLKRIEWERKVLGNEYINEGNLAWSQKRFNMVHERPNIKLINSRAESLLRDLRERFSVTLHASPDFKINDKEKSLYLDLITYVLYYRHFASFSPEWEKFLDEEKSFSLKNNWKCFSEDFLYYTHFSIDLQIANDKGEHLYACLYQVRRAFYHIFKCILGDSRPVIELRGKVWESIFTHNMRRYQRSLFQHMREIPTLITGESGTGKELVARSIALAQFLPFDQRKIQFHQQEKGGFIPLNLSALSPTLIESELFGHKKGSFTGATQDKKGWFEQCGRHDVIFLDEIGELDPLIQVKLLRILQDRTWSRIGETTEQNFAGKFMAATNRRLNDEIRNGTFRLDLFYRLCADHIETPNLIEQIQDRPESLVELVRLIAEKITGDEAEEISHETLTWIKHHLPDNYSWPGNIRELEQCVRNVLIRNVYNPLTPSSSQVLLELNWLHQAEQRTLTMQELQKAYTTWVYAQAGTYEAAAEKLGLDRRTVKSWINQDQLRQLKGI